MKKSLMILMGTGGAMAMTSFGDSLPPGFKASYENIRRCSGCKLLKSIHIICKETQKFLPKEFLSVFISCLT